MENKEEEVYKMPEIKQPVLTYEINHTVNGLVIKALLDGKETDCKRLTLNKNNKLCLN